MAPTPKISSRNKQQNSNSINNRRKEVSFKKREYPQRNTGAPAKPQENYENLILYYLTKLKGLFANPDHPTPGKREHSGEKMRRELLNQEKKVRSKMDIDPNKYVARQSTPKPRHNEQDHEIRDKIYDVVSAAIEYGYKNKIIERKGNYFMLRSKRNPKLANRQPTPGPSYGGCSCSRCKAMEADGTFQQSPRPVTASTRREFYSGRDFQANLLASDACNPVSTETVARSKSCNFSAKTPCPMEERVKKSCNCKKCLLAEKTRKMS